jgi:hypothetical protein
MEQLSNLRRTGLHRQANVVKVKAVWDLFKGQPAGPSSPNHPRILRHAIRQWISLERYEIRSWIAVG